MNKLFILGNGFDIEHKLKTRYSDFKKFLKEYLEIEDSPVSISVPSLGVSPDGGVSFNEKDVGKFIYHWLDCNEIIGDDWSNFEESLGEMNFTRIFCDNLSEVYDKEGDINEWHTLYNREDIASEIYASSGFINVFFQKWINSINLDKTHKLEKFENIYETDYVFTFNYTETVEKVYGVVGNNICHIHGKVGEDTVIGHGLDDKLIEEKYNTYQLNYLGAEDKLYDIIRSFKKPVEDLILENESFFEDISDITDIYSFGFSFADVDLPYIEKICESINTENVLWHQNI